MRSYVFTMSSDFGNWASGRGVAIRSCSAGTASATRRPPASTAETSGRRRTRSTIARQMRPSPSRRSRPTNGTCSRSTRSPSFESSAGSTVSEPSTATATTMIVAYPNEAKLASPVRNRPAMATITVRPETSTERPEVAAAASRAARSLWPGGAPDAHASSRTSSSRRRPQARPTARRLTLPVRRQHLARQRRRPERREHGRERE